MIDGATVRRPVQIWLSFISSYFEAGACGCSV